VLGVAASEHRMGPAALAGGVALSFVAIGLFVATAGFAIGLDGDVFRTVTALLMIGVGRFWPSDSAYPVRRTHDARPGQYQILAVGRLESPFAVWLQK
jgi:hypothetical protein